MNPTCEQCGEPLPPKVGRGGVRRYCLTCSPPRPSAKTKTAPVVVLPLPPTSVYDATLRELKAAGLVDSVGGQLLLVLARAMSAEGQTASGLASCAKVFADIYDKAVVQARPLDDELARILDRADNKFPNRKDHR